MASDCFRCFGSSPSVSDLAIAHLTNAAERGFAPARPRLLRSALRLFRLASGQHDNKRDGDPGGHGASHLHGDVSPWRPHRHGEHGRLHAVDILSASKQNRAGGLFRALPNSPRRRDADKSRRLFSGLGCVFVHTGAVCACRSSLGTSRGGRRCCCSRRWSASLWRWCTCFRWARPLASDRFFPSEPQRKRRRSRKASERKNGSRPGCVSSPTIPGSTD